MPMQHSRRLGTTKARRWHRDLPYGLHCHEPLIKLKAISISYITVSSFRPYSVPLSDCWRAIFRLRVTRPRRFLTRSIRTSAETPIRIRVLTPLKRFDASVAAVTGPVSSEVRPRHSPQQCPEGCRIAGRRSNSIDTPNLVAPHAASIMASRCEGRDFSRPADGRPSRRPLHSPSRRRAPQACGARRTPLWVHCMVFGTGPRCAVPACARRRRPIVPRNAACLLRQLSQGTLGAAQDKMPHATALVRHALRGADRRF